MTVEIIEDGFPAQKLFNQGYSYIYDDVIFLPHYIDFPTDAVSLSTKLSRNIPLSIPCVSSPMDTLTESYMATAMAALGGLGIIHCNMSCSDQADTVRSVKFRRVPILSNPIFKSPDSRIVDQFDDDDSPPCILVTESEHLAGGGILHGNHDSKNCLNLQRWVEICKECQTCTYMSLKIMWDEFSESDDHIVPHPAEECTNQFRVNGDNHKKPRHEVISFASNASDAAKYTQKKEEARLPILTNKDRMLDKGSWSYTPDGVFSTGCDSDSVKEVTNIKSEETRASNHCLKSRNTDSVGGGFGSEGPTLGEKTPTDDIDTYHFPLSHISQTDNDLNFFTNDGEDRENNDLLYYGWPDDIGNFEDVDRMFRSCDSTFELGNLSNEDDLYWFSSSYSTEGSEDALKLSSKFSSYEANVLNCISEHHEASRVNSAGPSANDPNKKSLLMGDKISSNTAGVADDFGLNHLQFSNGSDTRSVIEDELMHKEQISSQKSQARHRNHSEGKRKDRNLDNGGSFHHNGSLKQLADTKSFGDSSHRVFSSPGVEKLEQNQNTESGSLNYMPTNMLRIQMDYGHSSDQTSVYPSQCSIKSESNGLPSPSPKESSFASNQVQSVERSQGPLLDSPAVSNEKREKLFHHQDLQSQYARNFKCANTLSPTAFYDSVQNQTCQSEYELESHSEIEGVSNGVPAEVDSSNAQESSCMSSVLDEISLHASSFHQLQQVMEQLDIQTKLCIRDSLYRLARSAEQRHHCVNANDGKRDDRDTSGPQMAEETNKSTGFLDMETDTNPIDRSMAHLLFHRPSNPSVMLVNGAVVKVRFSFLN